MTRFSEVSGPRRELLDRIRRAGTHTVDELVTEVGWSKNTVRTHLLKMEQQGLIERVPVESNRPGRPPLAYRVAPAALGAFPTNDGELLTALINFLHDNGAQELLETFFQRVWTARDDELRAALNSIENPKLKDRLQALEVVLEQNHFLPSIEPQPQKDGPSPALTIRECNCPYPAAIRATHMPCELEAKFLTRVVGLPPTSIKLKSTESEPCIFQWASIPELIDED